MVRPESTEFTDRVAQLWRSLCWCSRFCAVHASSATRNIDTNISYALRTLGIWSLGIPCSNSRARVIWFHAPVSLSHGSRVKLYWQQQQSWLIASFALWRVGFAPRSVHVGFVGKVALGEVSLRVFWFSAVSINPPLSVFTHTTKNTLEAQFCRNIGWLNRNSSYMYTYTYMAVGKRLCRVTLKLV
jgi:hypothetical protein